MALVHLREATLDPVDPAAYRLQLFGLMHAAGDITGGADTAMVKLLDDARAEIQATLGALALDSPSRQVYERALRGVETATANLADRMNKTIADYQAQGLALGVDLATKPVGGERGFDVVSNAITGEQLRILSGYSASLVQDITTTIRSKINGEIASIVIGAKSPYAASVAIGKNLTDPNHFRSIAHRARAIVVTEVGRAQALGTQVGQQALQATLKAGGFTDVVLKRWINAHLPGARRTHLEAEARYALDGSTGPIPVGDLFEVAGYKALYPRDPSLPASESVHCHCFSVTVFAEGPDPLAGNAKTDLQDTYTGALNTAAAPAEIATKKHVNSETVSTFVKNPYAPSGIPNGEGLGDGAGWTSPQKLAKTLYPTDLQDAIDNPNIIDNKNPVVVTLKDHGWTLNTSPDGSYGWQHPKAVGTNKQLPDFDQLTGDEKLALMDAAGLTPSQQNAVLKHYAAKKPSTPAPYTTSKPIAPPDNTIAKPIATPEPPKAPDPFTPPPPPPPPATPAVNPNANPYFGTPAGNGWVKAKQQTITAKALGIPDPDLMPNTLATQEMLTNLGSLPQPAVKFLTDPYAAAGLQPSTLVSGSTGYGKTYLEKALGYDPAAGDLIYDSKAGWWKHKLAPPGAQLPSFAELSKLEQQALMANANLSKVSQNKIWKASGKVPPPPLKNLPTPPAPAANNTGARVSRLPFPA